MHTVCNDEVVTSPENMSRQGAVSKIKLALPQETCIRGLTAERLLFTGQKRTSIERLLFI